MSVLNKLTERLNALEEEVKTLRAVTPLGCLQAFTAGLKTASPEDIKEWMAVFQEIAGPLAPSVSSSAPSEKPKKTKKEPTNAAGPTEWNVFIHQTLLSMAAEAGIIQSDFESEAVFRKAVKDAGITRQKAMTEASRRKALLEGKDPNAPKKTRAKKEKPASEMAAMKEKVAAGLSKVKKAKAPSVGGGLSSIAEETSSQTEESEAEESQSVAESEAEAADAGLASNIADAEEMGWEKIKIEGVLHFLDKDTQSVYNTELDQVGEFVKGVYERRI